MDAFSEPDESRPASTALSPSRSPARRWFAAIAALLLLAAAIGLWARHGAAVFFDMVAAGVAYCF